MWRLQERPEWGMKGFQVLEVFKSLDMIGFSRLYSALVLSFDLVDRRYLVSAIIIDTARCLKVFQLSPSFKL